MFVVFAEALIPIKLNTCKILLFIYECHTHLVTGVSFMLVQNAPMMVLFLTTASTNGMCLLLFSLEHCS